MGLFDFSASTAPLNRGFRQAKKLTKKFSDKAAGEIESGKDESIGYQEKALPVYDDLLSLGRGGVDAYGTYDPDQGQAGVDAFKNSTDYLLSRDAARAGLDSIGRSYAGTGQVGQSMIDAMDYMNRFDSGILGNVRNAYSPYWNAFGQGTSGKAGVYQGMGDTAFRSGLGKSQVWSNAGSQMAPMAMQHGQNLWTADQSGINNMWGAILGLGSGLTGMFA